MTTDRAFTKAVGISTSCHMCDLLSIESHRNQSYIAVLENLLVERDSEIRGQQEIIHMWQLAFFAAAGAVLLLILACWSFHAA